MAPYLPNPLDTAHIQLSSDLLDLVEHLAENTHDVWARQRVADGWQYGARRNDALKQHPGLVAYSELAESEKEYDRQTAMETVKTLVALGFEIVSPERRSEQGDSSALRAAAEAAVAKGSKVGLQQILAFWNGRNQQLWVNVPEIYRLLGEEVLKHGEPLLAYDILREGLDSCPGDVRLRQLFGLALARSGASETALPVLEQLREEGHSDEETLGLLARTYKDLAESVQPDSLRIDYRRKALDLYREAYQRSGGYWTGINAATLAVRENDIEEARRLARDVQSICLARLAAAEDPREQYWLQATLGEAALILGDWDASAGRYREAVKLAGQRYGDVSSTRRNARILLRHLEGDHALIEDCFAVPLVAVFTGHMIDKPERRSPRFPPELETAVRRSIGETLARSNIGMGYCSMACGSDILFAEEILRRNGELHVVLPYSASEFIRDSVDIIPGSDWRERCEAVLARAASVTVAADHTLNWGGTEYEYANRLLQGLACVRARQLDTEWMGVAVWDGRKGDGNGGTASTLDRWKADELDIEVIPLDRILASAGMAAPERAEEPLVESTADGTAPNFVPDILGLLFADAVGFSKLREDEVPGFVRHFLGIVGELADRSEHQPLFRNTWGDGIYMVFQHPAGAGSFALELSRLIDRTDWHAKGLRDLKLRIGVHAGPVYRCMDPVTHAHNYMGAHVSRAARIEPITPPGHVYASQAFAALASVARGTGFTSEYVGQIGMAKHYGVFPTYVLREARESGCAVTARKPRFSCQID